MEVSLFKVGECNSVSSFFTSEPGVCGSATLLVTVLTALSLCRAGSGIVSSHTSSVLPPTTSLPFCSSSVPSVLLCSSITSVGCSSLTRGLCSSSFISFSSCFCETSTAPSLSVFSLSPTSTPPSIDSIFISSAGVSFVPVTLTSMETEGDSPPPASVLPSSRPINIDVFPPPPPRILLNFVGSDFTIEVSFPNDTDTALAGEETRPLPLPVAGAVGPLSSFMGVLSGLTVGGEGDAEAIVMVVVPAAGLMEEATGGEAALTAGDLDGDLTSVFPPVDTPTFPSCCLAVEAAFRGF